MLVGMASDLVAPLPQGDNVTFLKVALLTQLCGGYKEGSGELSTVEQGSNDFDMIQSGIVKCQEES
jgi:hypothetical protein